MAFTSGNNVVAIGMKSFYSNFFNYYKSFFAISMKYDDGTVQMMKGYDYAEHITNHGVLVSHQSNHFYVEQLNKGGFAIFGEFSNFDPATNYFFRLTLNADLSINKSISYSVPLNLGKQWAKMRVLPNGETHIFCLTPTYQQLCWYSADDNNNVIRQKRIDYPGANIDLWYAPAANGNNAINFIVSRMFLPEGRIEVTQLKNQSTFINECIGTDTSFVQLVPWDAAEGQVSWQSIIDGGTVLTPLQLSASDIPITSEYVCDPEVSYDPQKEEVFKITGDSSVCKAGVPVQYVGRMQNGSAKVTWHMDESTYEKLEQVNDSTVSVIFKPQNGDIKVKLFAFTQACEVLTDSMEVTLHAMSDSTIQNYSTCEFPLKIKAGSGYRYYRWPNGSTAPEFNVAGTGTYNVELETYCGDRHTETITVNNGSCSNTVYIPNAFTPNNDGKNDVFGPAISGALQFYQMTVFNRWGQVVFKTNDSQYCWDGTYRGHPQKSEGFVYIISYRFRMEETKQIRGTFLLIR